MIRIRIIVDVDYDTLDYKRIEDELCALEDAIDKNPGDLFTFEGTSIIKAEILSMDTITEE